jgi:alanine dehydrogenase
MTVTRGIEMPKSRHAIPEMEERISKAPTLGELIAGMAPGRRAADEMTCFLNLTGIGLQFVAVGAVLYRKAREAGRGHELPTEWFTEDVLP